MLKPNFEEADGLGISENFPKHGVFKLMFHSRQKIGFFIKPKLSRTKNCTSLDQLQHSSTFLNNCMHEAYEILLSVAKTIFSNEKWAINQVYH